MGPEVKDGRRGEEKGEEGREGEGEESSQSHLPLKNPRSATVQLSIRRISYRFRDIYA